MSHSEFILIKSIFIFSNNQSKRKKMNYDIAIWPACLRFKKMHCKCIHWVNQYTVNSSIIIANLIRYYSIVHFLYHVYQVPWQLSDSKHRIMDHNTSHDLGFKSHFDISYCNKDFLFHLHKVAGFFQALLVFPPSHIRLI